MRQLVVEIGDDRFDRSRLVAFGLIARDQLEGTFFTARE